MAGIAAQNNWSSRTLPLAIKQLGSPASRKCSAPRGPGGAPCGPASASQSSRAGEDSEIPATKRWRKKDKVRTPTNSGVEQGGRSPMMTTSKFLRIQVMKVLFFAKAPPPSAVGKACRFSSGNIPRSIPDGLLLGFCKRCRSKFRRRGAGQSNDNINAARSDQLGSHLAHAASQGSDRSTNSRNSDAGHDARSL